MITTTLKKFAFLFLLLLASTSLAAQQNLSPNTIVISNGLQIVQTLPSPTTLPNLFQHKNTTLKNLNFRASGSLLKAVFIPKTYTNGTVNFIDPNPSLAASNNLFQQQTFDNPYGATSFKGAITLGIANSLLRKIGL